jgi:RNA polymerase sigma factor for flagellar operon FliA
MKAATNVYQQQAEADRLEGLIVGNLDYVRHILGKLVVELPTGVDEENLMSAGTLGLIEAANSYDEARGVAFRTFAYRRIRGAIIDELRRNCPLPQRVLENMGRVRAARLVLRPPVSIETLVTHTGLSHREVEECLEASRLTAQHSWEESDEGRTISTGREPDAPESRLQAEETRDELKNALLRLPERERICLTLYYMEDLRLKEIGVVLGISESRVSRILSRAEFQLREVMRGASSANDWR